jgi:protein TonB
MATYPPRAANAGVEGRVDIEFTVGPDGATRDITIIASSPAGVFDHAARDAVGQWRYQPLEVDGIAVPARTRVRLRFVQNAR